MAKERIYRHDIRCPECGSNWVCKNGHQKNGKQKYRCNDCNKYFFYRKSDSVNNFE